MKRQPPEWENIFANDTSDNGVSIQNMNIFKCHIKNKEIVQTFSWNCSW